MISVESNRKITFIGLLMWFIAALFFLDEFFLRVFMGTIAKSIMSDFKLNAQMFSLMCASYYITYSIMQIPVGFLIDKLGVKKILSFACLICGTGVFLFAFTQNFYIGFFSRLLIGFGSSFAFVSLLVISLNWFPVKYFGFFSGFSQFLGGVGPFLAGAPLAILLAIVNNNWRLVLIYIGIFTISLAVIILIFLKDKPKNALNKVVFISKNISGKNALLLLLKNRQVIFIILTAGIGYVSIPILGAYWGVTFLEIKGLSKTAASTIVSFIWIGYAVGCPIIGKFSDLIKRRKPFLTYGLFSGIISTSLLLLFNFENVYLLSFIFFLIGISGSSLTVTFPLVTEQSGQELKGIAMGLNNTVVMGMGAIIPPICTLLIQHSAKIHSTTNVLNYMQNDFTKGLSLMPFLFLLALLISLFGIDETFCRSKTDIYKISI
jgi:MFS family permease